MKYTTIDEIVTYFDEQVPNQYTREEKTRWIDELDERIYEDIIKPRTPRFNNTVALTSADIGNEISVYLTLADYNDCLNKSGTQFTIEQIEKMVTFTPVSADVGKTFGKRTFAGYDDNTNVETVVLAPSAFKDMYRYYIEKNVDINNREIGAANNAIAMFQSYFEDYYAWYNRNHRIVDRKRIII